MMINPEHLRQQAKEARNQARFATDPVTKVKLHEIAKQLETLADHLEQSFDPDRRS